MRIDPVIRNLVEGAKSPTMSKGSGEVESSSFADQLKSKINEVNQLQNEADSTMAAASVKGASNIHETMIKLEEANLGLLMLSKVRNKALEAYHEMMRMQF